VLLVGYTDNVLTGRAFAIRGGYSTDANQEFLALGAANVGAGLFQGFPVSSSGSRTAIGDAQGSRTRLHSLVGAGQTHEKAARVFDEGPVAGLVRFK